MRPLLLLFLLRVQEAPSFDREEAMERVMRSPEGRAWAAGIRSKSDAVPLAMLDGGVAGISWDIGLFESHPTHLVRWSTFQVDARWGELRIWDVDRDAWRSLP